MIHKRPFSFLVLIFLTSRLLVFSQPVYYSFEHLTIEDGLSQNTVTSIIQDSRGFMWFGSSNGLNRFDGYSFKTFMRNNADSTTISHNHIQVLFEDSQQRLWVGTIDGLNLMNQQTCQFIRFIHHAHDSSSISSNNITSIFEDKDGNIWVGTSFGLNRYIEKNQSFEQFIYTAAKSNCLSNNLVSSIHSNMTDNLWIGTLGGGLNLLDLKTKKFTHYKKGEGQSLNDNNIWSVIEDTLHGKVWIGTESGGLNVLYPKTGEVRHYRWSQEKLKNQGENMVRTMTPGLNNDIWIGTDGGGLYQLNHVLRYNHVVRHVSALPESLAGNSITSIYRDRQNILWVGLVDQGIDRLDLNPNPFQQIMNIPDQNNSLSNNVVNSIIQDQDGEFWIGTDWGLDRVTKTFDHFIHYTENYRDQYAINNNAVISLAEADNGEIWAGTYLGGINIFNKQTGQFRALKHHEKDLNSLSSNFVRTIYKDSHGDFWIGTFRGGMNRYNPKTGVFTRYQFSSDNTNGIASDYIMKIVGQGDDLLWIATYNEGLNRFNKKTGKFTSYKANHSDSTSINDNQVITLFFDSDSLFWIGTANGLNLFNPDKGVTQRYNVSDGLPDNVINAIQEDDQKNLWISTNKGLSCFNKQTRSFRNFSEINGLNEFEFKYNAACKATNNQLLFGGINGVTRFNPSNTVVNPTDQPVHFIGIQLFNNLIKTGEKIDGRVILTKPLYDLDKISFSYRESDFSIFFSTLSYKGLKQIKYEYLLDESDSNWIFLGTQNYITFHQLAPGDYLLRIKATNSDGNWNEKDKQLKIHISPPFWNAVWFKSLIIIAFIALVLFIYLLRIKQIKRQKKRLEELVSEKTLDLQETNALLEEQQMELELQFEELMAQREHSEKQNKEIIRQNLELERHQNNLEEIIKERTSELIEAKEKAEKADALKTAFLANMSHEIRTPMNAILGFANLICEESCLPDERAVYQHKMNESGQSLLSLINDIIDLAKFESGELKINRSPFELNEVCHQLLGKYIQKGKRQNDSITFYLELPQNQVIINSDKYRVEQIFINLLDNALKFTEKGDVVFGFKLLDETILLYVKDSGIGIAATELNAVFNHFRKIEPNNAKLYRGTGLGLTISKQLVELLGGKIWVESEVNIGSVFYFTLPNYGL